MSESRRLVDQRHRWAGLGTYRAAVDAALSAMDQQRVMARIWAHDHTVWKPDPREITNRLGWLHTAEAMRADLPCLEEQVEAVRAGGITQALLLGMGGSSLAPEVFSQVFGTGDAAAPGHRGVELTVLDSTDPGAVLAQAERTDRTRALFIVATKSGTTTETLAFFRFFYNRVADELGRHRAGEHCVAITDPGSPLADLAERYHFRATFLSDPSIGGRYSALSHFGLVPALLLGVDVGLLLERASEAAARCGPSVPVRENTGAWLGTIMGTLAKAGRDKLTLAISPEVSSFGDWIEQLVAESTGKEGVGILPVVGESLETPEAFSDDRLFVHVRLADDETHDAALEGLRAAGHPVVRLGLRDRYDLGGQFFLWEMATAVAGHHLGVNPFEQPNVEAAKVLARKMVAEYRERGVLPDGETAPLTARALQQFLAQARPGDYLALQAYLPPTDRTTAALQALRRRLREAYRLATTVGYGPRFLHSTGQLHKGDAGRGLFIQLTADDPRDVPIPDEAGLPASSVAFGVLEAAQALGDRQALLDAGRRVIHFHLGEDVVGGLERLAEVVA
jgi:transaldolase/glucose-6-phosphate isomerase